MTTRTGRVKVQPVNISEAVTARVKRLLNCPSCRATRFHEEAYVEIDQDGKQEIVIREYRCININCNRVFSLQELQAT